MQHPPSNAAADTNALSTFRDAVKAEEKLLILIGSELRGADLKRLIDFGLTIPGAKFALLSDYANSRGAADMGLLPDMLPGYTPLAGNTTFAEYNAPTAPGLDMLEIFEAAGRGELSALYVVGSNPIARYSVDPAALKDTFVVVQDMFLTETARSPTSSFPPPTSTKNPAPSPTATATSSSSTRPATAQASAPTSR